MNVAETGAQNSERSYQACLRQLNPSREPMAMATQATMRRTVLLALAICVAAIPALLHSPGSDPDVWWHLRSGSWILLHHSVPRSEPFSWTMQGKPYVAYTWLFDVMLEEAHRTGGLIGIAALTAGFSALIFASLFLLLWERRKLFLWTLVVTLTVVFALTPVMTPRPWLFTIWFFIVELAVLLRVRETENAKLLLVLPLLFVLWANIHIQFVYGLFTLGLFALEASVAPLLKKKFIMPCGAPPSHLWLATSVSTLATLATPYGVYLYSVVWEYANERAPLRLVIEMQSPDFHSPLNFLCVLAVAAVGFSIAKRGRRCEPVLIALIAVACWFAFRSSRDIWFFAIPVAAFITVPSSNKIETLYRWQWLGAGGLALIIILLIAAKQVSHSKLSDPIAKAFPVAACNFVNAEHAKDRLFNSYTWGGYLIWCAPEAHVSMDGRANVHGDARIEQSAKTWAGSPEWRADPDLLGADIAVVESNSALASLLRVDHDFQVIYQDPVGTVFERKREVASAR